MCPRSSKPIGPIVLVPLKCRLLRHRWWRRSRGQDRHPPAPRWPLRLLCASPLLAAPGMADRWFNDRGLSGGALGLQSFGGLSHRRHHMTAPPDLGHESGGSRGSRAVIGRFPKLQSCLRREPWAHFGHEAAKRHGIPRAPPGQGVRVVHVVFARCGGPEPGPSTQSAVECLRWTSQNIIRNILAELLRRSLFLVRWGTVHHHIARNIGCEDRMAETTHKIRDTAWAPEHAARLGVDPARRERRGASLRIWVEALLWHLLAEEPLVRDHLPAALYLHRRLSD